MEAYRAYEKRRDAKLLSNYQVAKETGVSQTALSNWSRNVTQTPSVETLQKLAQFFGCTIDELLSGQGI